MRASPFFIVQVDKCVAGIENVVTIRVHTQSVPIHKTIAIFLRAPQHSQILRVDHSF